MIFTAILFVLPLIYSSNLTNLADQVIAFVKDLIDGEEEVVEEAPYEPESKETLDQPKEGEQMDAAAQLIALVNEQYKGEEKALKKAADELGNPADYPPHYSPKSGETYDFVVVGAGMAGCVIANRLTEISKWKVLLIEAGGNPTKAMDVPLLAPTLYDTEVDWKYVSEPSETSCLGMKNKSCSFRKGKVMGGTFNIGSNFYYTLDDKDYDKWEAEGSTGWSYKNMLPYLIKQEDMRIKEVLKYSPGYHGTGGYLPIEEWVEYGTFTKHLTAAMTELGYPLTPDANGRNSSVFSIVQGMSLNGRKVHPAKAYLSPIKNRSNLKVSKNSLVTKILIDEIKKTAYGVEFMDKEGKTVKVMASKEVILTAGVINSPQLLMLSGIGPKNHLEKLKIKTLADLPVGKNLHDILVLAGYMFVTNYSDTLPPPTKSMYDFLMKKPSILSNSQPLSHGAVITTQNKIDYPNVFTLSFRVPKNNSDLINRFTFGFKYDDWVTKQYLELNSKSALLIPLVSNMRPFSRGKIELRSTDPTVPPKITPGYLTDKRDIEDMLKFYDYLDDLMNTSGMRDIGAKAYEVKVPECEKSYKVGSRDYRICSLRYLSISIFQTGGTCKMGAKYSPDTVVDPRLRVKGIKNLRVIDYSVVRDANRGNCFLIPEKGADLIKEDWKIYSTNKYY